MRALSEAQVRQANEIMIEQLTTPGMEKRALDAVNDFTRVKIREEGFYRKIMPMTMVSNDQLTRRIDDDKPFVVVDKEPGSPAAMTIPFGQLPRSTYILGPRYGVGFARLVTYRFLKDKDELRTYIMDIRQVISDNAVKDMQAEEDTKFISACNSLMLGPDLPVPYNGNVVQWETISSGISREGWVDALKIMPRGPSNLQARVVLMNQITGMEMMKWGRDEMGGDLSQDIAKNGWAETEFLGRKLYFTIKRELIPDDTMFFFADPSFIGKSFVLEDLTMFLDRKAWMLEFFMYQLIGGGIGHSGGIARADFAAA